LGLTAFVLRIEGEVAELLELIRDVNGGLFGGLPDVIGRHGRTVLVREAKLGRGRDALRHNQHKLLRALRARLGADLDAAVGESREHAPEV
jgi:hypothetical protein